MLAAGRAVVAVGVETSVQALWEHAAPDAHTCTKAPAPQARQPDVQASGPQIGWQSLARALATDPHASPDPPMITAVFTRLPTPCMLNVSTTVSPRRFCSAAELSARSLADVDATGYSPPTPMPKINCTAVNMAHSARSVGPSEATMRMPPTTMVAAVATEPHLRPMRSAKKPRTSCPKMMPHTCV